MTGLERHLHDKRSISTLIEAALAEAELDNDTFAKSSQAICVLQGRGTRDVLDAALALCRSLDPKCRALAARILGELGWPQRTFPEECCDALLNLLKHDRSEDVIIAALFALGHLSNRRSDSEVIAFKDHTEPAIRYGVVFALYGTQSAQAVPALLALMEDTYVKARDWATTIMGEVIAFDSPAIRTALLRRAEDQDELVRVEALLGLARRGDTRAIPLIVDALSARSEHLCYFEDAAKTYLGIDIEQPIDPEILIASLLATRH